MYLVKVQTRKPSPKELPQLNRRFKLGKKIRVKCRREEDREWRDKFVTCEKRGI